MASWPVRERPLFSASLVAGLLSLLVLALDQAGVIWDMAWHNTPAIRVPFLGLPHPWIVPHFAVVAPLPIVVVLMARLYGVRDRRDGGLAVWTVRHRRAPLGAQLLLLWIAAISVWLGIDTIWHQVVRRDPRFNPVHVTMDVFAMFMYFSLVLLMFDLAAVPTGEVTRTANRLARAGLWLSLVWMVGAMLTLWPNQTDVWKVSTNVALATFNLGVAAFIAIRIWPWPFPASTAVVPYLLFRVVVYALLVNAGYTETPPTLLPLGLAAVATDLWLLLPFNQRRSVATLVVAAFVYSVASVVVGRWYFLPMSLVYPHTFGRTMLIVLPVGLAAAAIGWVAVELGLRALRRLHAREEPPPRRVEMAASPGQG